MIYIGSDHAGYKLKEKLKTYLQELGYQVDDKGAFALNNDDDYPDYVKLVARAVAEQEGNFGIVLGGSGQGEAMSANKIKGIRALVYYGGKNCQRDINGNKMGAVASARIHQNANVLSLGARFLSERRAKKAVKIFLETQFSNDERHIRRINKLEPSN
ncbi:MAG: RpiB/LacA/LacB family sugar-phosphate isomerase [Candidatus Paceibacterota bacterium]|jgi:ribose 5-phosphate isomerase B